MNDDRLAAEGIGQIVVLFHSITTAQDRLGLPVCRAATKYGWAPAEETKELVEAAFERMEPRREAQVPFADDARRIAGGFDGAGHGAFA